MGDPILVAVAVPYAVASEILRGQRGMLCYLEAGVTQWSPIALQSAEHDHEV